MKMELTYSWIVLYSCLIFGGYGLVPLAEPQTLLWVPCDSGDPIPKGAVRAGTDNRSEPLYVGRAYYNRDLLPAKIQQNPSKAYVSWASIEIESNHFEVLCHANVAWQTTQRNHIPPNAITIGSTVSGEKLYMGRTLHEKGLFVPGKVHPSHEKLYVTYNGKEESVPEYEIMVFRPPITVN